MALWSEPVHRIDELIAIENTLGTWEVPLAKFVYEYVTGDPTGHDIYHCLRVKELALRIAKGEELDRDVLVATAYLHDVGRGREHAGEGDHVGIGMRSAQEILPTLAFPPEKIPAVLRCIEHHEEYAWAGQPGASDHDLENGLENEILGFQDADRLDAIGAVGIARMFTFGGAYRRPIWIPEMQAGNWQHGTLGTSTYVHLYEKLFKLKDTMNTATGRKLAEARHRFMERFAEEFEQEWAGNR
jgi:uncharacterized protein